MKLDNIILDVTPEQVTEAVLLMSKWGYKFWLDMRLESRFRHIRTENGKMFIEDHPSDFIMEYFKPELFPITLDELREVTKEVHG